MQGAELSEGQVTIMAVKLHFGHKFGTELLSDSSQRAYTILTDTK